MTTYIYQRKGWPHFRWRDEVLAKPLAEARHHQGRLLGRMDELNPNCARSLTRDLTAEAVKSSEIEGEKLDEAQVRSSVARRLKIDLGPAIRVDRQFKAWWTSFSTPPRITIARSPRSDCSRGMSRFSGAERAGIDGIVVGQWRIRAPCACSRGLSDTKSFHYEAPPAHRVSAEMREFLRWFNRDGPGTRSGPQSRVAHLWFVTIHPFDDGNGRIARAIADMVLARSEQSPQRFYSMSAQIRRERNQYYDYLEETQKGDLDITAYLRWFLGCLDRALANAGLLFGDALRKARFWETYWKPFNDRQRMMLDRMLDGFEGKLTSSKWARLTKCSQDTAARDIDALTKLGILAKDAAGGRSTSYSLVEGQ